MSGQQIGTVVGGAIGAVVGGFAGAQVGMAIGGLIGGAIDPVKTYGPHIGDGQTQSATDGSPIAWVMGTMWTAGTIVDVGPRREVKVKDKQQGKGGGTQSYHYEAHQSFAILVCESDALKGSTISNVLMVEQDGKIVYDVRPGSTMASDSAKWAANVQFYYGGEAQLTPPSLDAIHGAGNSPAYRGALLAIFNDFNLSSVGDRIPQFRFLVSSIQSAGLQPESVWRYKVTSIDDDTNYSSSSFDDSAWTRGAAPFGASTGGTQIAADNAHAYDARFPAHINTIIPAASRLWMRTSVQLAAIPTNPVLVGYFDNTVKMWVNDALVVDRATAVNTGLGVSLPASAFVVGTNNIVVQSDDTGAAGDDANAAIAVFVIDGVDVLSGLADAITRINARGGIAEIDVTDIAQTPLLGYAIAKQMDAVSALGPLLGAHFAYGSEYDGKIHFDFYGKDAVMTIDEEDLLEANDANGNAVTANLRNNATEFPRRIVGQYYDPAQNYMPVTVMQTRRAAGITATGDRSFDIPVVMPADQAQQTVDKALKVAYAQLEGTLEFSVPFAGKSNVYLSLVPGDAVLFRGRRWIVTNPIISTGYIKLTIQYDRQGAYTSNVQAVAGIEPTTPLSRYSGPTTLIPMNLPALQTGDNYGLYLAAGPVDPAQNWRGCDVQMSLDSGATWQSVTQIRAASTWGALTAIDTGTTLVAQVNDDLESVGSAQLDARQNAAVLLHGTAAEVLQFGTATEDPVTAHLYTLTDMRRHQLGTTQISGVVGDKFVMLDNVVLLPIDLTFAGQTIQLRGVGFGEDADSATVVSIVYNPDTTVIHDGGTVT